MHLAAVLTLLFFTLSSCTNRKPKDANTLEIRPIDSTTRIFLQLRNQRSIPDMQRASLAFDLIYFGKSSEGKEVEPMAIYSGDYITTAYKSDPNGNYYLKYVGEGLLLDSMEYRKEFEWLFSIVLATPENLRDKALFEVRRVDTDQLIQTIFMASACTIELARNNYANQAHHFSEAELVDTYAAALCNGELINNRFMLRDGTGTLGTPGTGK
jgi:hypothetical protein